jgi:hypothetical protein
MATELENRSSLQSFADATCLIYDRSVIPEKVIGQAWLVSKSRVATLASAVTNYSEAPWALIARFPHPDLTFAVKNVHLHPDFNKREARDAYLAQVTSQARKLTFDNDIATLTLEPEITPVAPERLAELNRALSLPFQISPQDLSGVMRAGEAPNIIQNSIMTGRSGLLTMLDGRNIPFARLQIKAGRLARAMFNQLTNELAVCEIIWRKPSGNYVFQTSDNFNWGETPEIGIPTEQLAAEASRRTQEMPRVIDMLGGPDVKFQRATQQADFSSMNPQQRWVAERLWETINGFLPLSKLSERVNSDTYTILKTLWEMRGMGMVSISSESSFHMNGQLGAMLAPTSDVDAIFWDPITAFYLDPVSGGPMMTTGHFVGGGKLSSPKLLLHTAPVPSNVQGAAILKDGKLVGIHTGPFPVRNAQAPFQLYQMQSLTALNDLGVKRLRTTEVETMQEPDVSQSLRMPSARQRLADTMETAAQPEEAKEELTGAMAIIDQFTKQQLAIGGLALSGVLFILMIIGFMSHGSAPPPTTTTTTGSTTTTTTAKPPEPVSADVSKAIAIATSRANFKETPADSYRYEDTSKLSLGKESFQLVSTRKNDRVIFAVWPNDNPMKDISAPTNPMATTLPFYGYRFVQGAALQKGVHGGRIQYNSGKYAAPDGNIQATIGVFQIPSDPPRTIVFAAIPDDPKKNFDWASSLSLVDAMLRDPGSASSGSGEAIPEAAFATPPELAEYRKKIEDSIKGTYKAPKEESEGDNKASITIGVNAKGELTKKSFTKSAESDTFNTALLKAVDATTFPAPPKTKSGAYEVLITADGGKITVEEP